MTEKPTKVRQVRNEGTADEAVTFTVLHNGGVAGRGMSEAEADALIAEIEEVENSPYPADNMSDAFPNLR
jgi:hypothetical protein